LKGQNDNERDLADYCAPDAGADILILSFLSTFGNGRFPSGFIGSRELSSDGSCDGCDDLARQIEVCKANGKKVFISLGGAGSDWQLTSAGDAQGVAFSLWNSFANPAVTSNSPRPFGDTFIDGWDIDIESDNGSQFLGVLVNSLRGHFASDPDNQYFISGAPQCPLGPIADMDQAIKEAQFDYIFIQFYNNFCSANDLFRDSNGNPNGPGGRFNLPDWPGYLAGSASANAKLHVGIPGSTVGASEFDFIDINNLPGLLEASRNTPGFNGFMMWDAANSDIPSDRGCNYAQHARNVLDFGAICSDGPAQPPPDEPPAPPSDWWFPNIDRSDPNANDFVPFLDVFDYQVYVAVNDAKGRRNAIASGGPHGGRDNGWLAGQPRVVYIAPGLYELDSTLFMFTDTILIGDASNPPTISASSSFSGTSLIVGGHDSPGNGGELKFSTMIKNVILDTTKHAGISDFTALNWRVAQNCGLVNVQINLPQNVHTGGYQLRSWLLMIANGVVSFRYIHGPGLDDSSRRYDNQLW
jgi:chitinase